MHRFGLLVVTLSACLASAAQGQVLGITQYNLDRDAWRRALSQPKRCTILEHDDTMEEMAMLYYATRRLHPWPSAYDGPGRLGSVLTTDSELPYSFGREGIRARVEDGLLAPGWLSFLPLGYVYRRVSCE